MAAVRRHAALQRFEELLRRPGADPVLRIRRDIRRIEGADRAVVERLAAAEPQRIRLTGADMTGGAAAREEQLRPLARSGAPGGIASSPVVSAPGSSAP